MKHLSSLLVATALLALLPSHLRAADLRNVLAEYSLTSWTQKDGLTSTVIWTLAQDAVGYLWMGTDAGLLRFDGVRFVSWESFATVPRPPAAVRSLCAAHDGTLWFGLGEPGGVGSLRDGEVRLYGIGDGLPEGLVMMLSEDTAGTIWAGGRFGLYRFIANRWEKADHGLPPGIVYSLFADTDGSTLATTALGVFRRPAGGAAFARFEAFVDVTRSIARDREGRLWVTDPIVGYRQLNERRAPTHAVEKGRGLRLLYDSRGNLWVGTGGQGLWRVQHSAANVSELFEKASTVTGFSDDGVTAMLEDREGNIWAATLDGLDRLTPHKMSPITNLGLVSAVDVTRDGRVYVGTVDAVVPFPDGVITARRVSIPIGHPPLTAMHADEQGTLWVATAGELMRVVSGRSSIVPMAGARLSQIDDITSDGQGGVWLHDIDVGLQHWNRGRVSAAPLPHEFKQSGLQASYTDRDGRAWFAFENQRVAVIDAAGEVRVYTPSDGLTGGIYRSIHQDRAGVVWLGGSGGLTRYAGTKFETLPASDSFPASSVTAVIDDDEGSLWLGLQGAGILRIGTEEFSRGLADRSYQVRYGAYDKFDGSAGTSRWFGNRSAARAPDGRLWFVAGRGITVIDPQVLKDENAIPTAVRIEGAVADGRRLSVRSEGSFPPRTARVQIDYTVLNLTSAFKTRFRYRLDGFDSDWIDAGTRQQAFYTNLPPRSYSFRVMASNPDGTFAEPGAAWAFAIQPIFYQTTWFVALCVALVMLSVSAAWRLHVLRVRKEFSLLLGERARLSREIHDTLLQSLFGVALQCDALATDVALAAPSLKDQFLRMRHDVEEDIQEARQSIWNLRSPKLESHGLAAALQEIGDHATASTGVRFTFAATGPSQACPPAVEEQLLRIGRECIVNVVRHAQAATVRMELAGGERGVSLSVSDDGRGFDPAAHLEAGDHYGLTTMRERAESVGGTLSIVSAVGQGTVVTTTIPRT